MTHWSPDLDVAYKFSKIDPSEFLEDFDSEDSISVVLECHNLVGVDSTDVLIDSKSPYASEQEVTSIGYDFLINKILNKTLNNVDCLVCVVEPVPNDNQILKNNYFV